VRFAADGEGGTTPSGPPLTVAAAEGTVATLRAGPSGGDDPGLITRSRNGERVSSWTALGGESTLLGHRSGMSPQPPHVPLGRRSAESARW